MPVYEYKCKECGTAFEHLARTMSRTTDIRCPSCAGEDVEKSLSVFSAREGASRPAHEPGSCRACCAADGTCPYNP